MYIKYPVFLLHYSFILYNLLPYFTYNIYFYPFIIISWEINDNYCILSQLEEKYLGETLLLQKKAKPLTSLQKNITYR